MEKKKILNLSIDTKLFEEGSAVAARFVEYGKLFDEFNAVVYTRPGFKVKQLAPNVRIFPTNTLFKPFFFFDMVKVAKKYITKDTIVSSQEAMTNLVAVKLKEKLGTPFQAQVHTDFMSPFYRKESWKNALRLRIYKKTLPKADFVRVVSKRVLGSIQQLITCPPDHVTVLPLFLNKEKLEKETISVDLRAKYPQFSFILLMASRFEVEKNILMALRSFKRVVTLHPRTGLVLVGRGSQLKRIQREIKKLGLSKNVILLDWAESLSSYYRSAHAFLSTSNYEGYGMTLVEAAFFGLPLVTTDVGVTGDIFENNVDALLCAPQDGKCFTLHIMRLIEDNLLRTTLAMNAKAKIDAVLMNKDDYMKAYQGMFD